MISSQPAPKIEDDRVVNEVGLIGALLHYQDPVLYRAAAAICEPDHFFEGLNARLFFTIGRGVDAGLSGFPLIHWLMAEMRGDETMTDLGWSSSQMVAFYCGQACLPAIAIEGAARQVKHDCLSVKLSAAVEDGDTAAAEEIAAEMERLSKAHLTKDSSCAKIGAISSAVVNRVSEAYAHGVLTDDMAYPGSDRLADCIGGWRRGRLYVVGGRPGSGKTTVGLSLLLRTALKGHGVLLFELEMGSHELMEMALCDLAWSKKERIEYRDLSSSTALRSQGMDRKIEAIIEADRALRATPFIISDAPGLTIAEIRSRAMQHAQRLEADGKRLDVICIDHLNLVKSSARYSGNKVAETEEVSNAFKALAKELKCAVVVLCQLNRGVESREDKRPGLADLRWTGAIEQDADVVMFVYRESYYLQKPVDDPTEDIVRLDRLREVENKLEIIVAKHRGGPTPTLDFYCDMGCAVVRDLVQARR